MFAPPGGETIRRQTGPTADTTAQQALHVCIDFVKPRERNAYAHPRFAVSERLHYRRSRAKGSDIRYQLCHPDPVSA